MRDVIDQRAWRDAYLAELDRYASETSDRVVTSVFFGGGTPSLMPVDTMTRIIRRIGDDWTLAEDIEITAEANPSSAEIEVFQGFKDAGINRLSLGVQSFDDRQLAVLGRLHSAGEAIKAIAASQTIFQRTSFDLIYARPGQTAGAWRQELARALDMAVGHLSLYQLTIEPGTDFHRLRVPAAEEGLAEQLFDITQEMTEFSGLPGYEISNHARAGDE